MGKQGISQEAEAARVRLESGVRLEEDLAKLPQKLEVSFDSKGDLILPPEIKSRLESLAPEQRRHVDELLQKINLEQKESQRPKDLLERFLGVLNNSAKGLSHTFESALRITLGNIYQLAATAIGILKLENPLEVWISSGVEYKKFSKYVFDNISLGSVYPADSVLAKMGKLERVMLSNPLAHLSSAIFDPLYDGIDYLKNELRRGIMNASGADLSEKQFLELAKTDPLLRISSFAFNIAQGSLMLISIICGNFQGVARLTKLLLSSGTFSLVSSIGNQLLHKEETNYIELVEGTVDQMAKSLTFSGGLRLLGAKHASLGHKIDFVDAQGDLSAAAVQLSNEIEKLESWSELKERKVQRRLAGAGLLGLTSAYDAVDAKVTGILDFKIEKPELDSENKVLQDIGKLLALDPQALEEFIISLTNLNTDLSNSIYVEGHRDRIELITKILCLLGEKAKEVNPELNQICLKYAENLLFHCSFEDLLKLNSVWNFTPEEKSQAYKAYCLRKIETHYETLFYSAYSIRGMLLSAGIAFENKRLLEDLIDVATGLESKLDQRRYLILLGEFPKEVENAILKYIEIREVTWPMLDQFITEAFNIFGVNTTEERNDISNNARITYFHREFRNRIQYLADDILRDLSNNKRFPDHRKKEFIRRVLECFDLSSLEIREKELTEERILNPVLQYKKTASGYFIDLTAITVFMDVFYNARNIPGASAAFSEVLSTLSPKQKKIITNGLTRILVCCGEGDANYRFITHFTELLGLSESGILSPSVEEAILCCYNLGRDPTLPIVLVQTYNADGRWPNIGFYRNRVKKLHEVLAPKNFALSRDAKLYAYQFVLMHIIEIAQMPNGRDLPLTIVERIGFACDLVKKHLVSEEGLLAEQTKKVYDETSWQDKDNFHSFHLNLRVAAYVIATTADVEEAFRSLFYDIFSFDRENLKRLFNGVLDLALDEEGAFPVRFSTALASFKYLALTASNFTNLIYTELNNTLKNKFCILMLERLTSNNKLYQVLASYSRVFGEDQMKFFSMESLEQLVNYQSKDVRDQSYLKESQLVRLRAEIISLCRTLGLSDSFKNEILAKLKN